MQQSFEIRDNRETLGRHVDEEGFARKPREGAGIFLWLLACFISMVSWNLPDDLFLVSLILWPATAYLALLAIKKYSSHDIDTWQQKHVSGWVFAGCLLAGIVGVAVYYVFKVRERNHLNKTRCEVAECAEAGQAARN